jgi:hypothetical protein
MWGKPKEGLFGVIPKAIQLAEREHADFVFWCSGIPVQGGRTISPHALEFTVARGKELLACEGMATLDISKLVQKSVLDEDVPNTHEEIVHAAIEFKKHGIERVFLVSPPKHIFRAHQEALTHQAAGHLEHIEICAVASDIDFPNTAAGQVAIIEPPHRADLPMWQTYRYARAVIELLQRNDVQAFEAFLKEWGTLLEKYHIEISWPPRK